MTLDKSNTKKVGFPLSIIITLCDYLLIIAIVFNANSVYALGYGKFAASCFALAISSGLYFLLGLLLHRDVWQRTTLIVILLASCTLVIQLLLAAVHSDGSFSSGIWIQYTVALPLMAGGFICRGYDIVRRGILVSLTWFGTLIALISLVFWSLSNFAGLQASKTLPMLWADNGTIYSYYNLYYNVQQMYVGSTLFWRNCGVFSEPPMYAAFLGIILALNIYIREKENRFCSIIVSITLLTTLSTGSLIYLAMLWLPKIYQNTIQKRKTVIRYFWLFLATIIVFFAVIYLTSAINEKISDTHSGKTHFADLIYGTQIWLDNPFFGHGLNSDDFIWSNYMIFFRAGLGYTSGILYLLIHGGILLGLCAIIPLILGIAKSRNWQDRYFILFVVFVFIFAVVQTDAIFIFSLAFCYLITFEKKAKNSIAAMQTGNI
ncbi:hypothetical protein [Bifidobacterium choloepi]|uniref:O-antigen ligase family protein n=1 Tax=Bifidobacterium choloepi TaxID=2614131 RepID=A0A6I5NNR9_9BIFI|nr:hypothetical protein [Bifidobacterium choloepi]NEG70352.1 hypothetical protein [Bifidobacterium choloepi]